MYILVGGEKGGAGKSTLASMLAIEAVKHGKKVLLVDGDAQSTSSNWIARRKALTDLECPDVIKLDGDTFQSYLAKHEDKYDEVIIDISGRDSKELRVALSFVDLALFPVPPTLPSIETSKRIDELVGEYAKDNAHLQAALFVLWQVPTNAKAKEAALVDAVSFLQKIDNLEIADNYGCYRTAYQKAADVGISVSERLGDKYPKNPDASNEIRNLYFEILDYEKVMEEAS